MATVKVYHSVIYPYLVHYDSNFRPQALNEQERVFALSFFHLMMSIFTVIFGVMLTLFVTVYFVVGWLYVQNLVEGRVLVIFLHFWTLCAFGCLFYIGTEYYSCRKAIKIVGELEPVPQQ